MFERGERQRQADRARMASLGGYVGRNLGDQPYIMDLVYQDHFTEFNTAAGGRYTKSLDGTGAAALMATPPTALRFQSGATSFGRAQVFGNAYMSGYVRDISIRVRARISSVDSSARVVVGLATGTPGASEWDGVFLGANGAVSTSYFTATSRKSDIATVTELNGAYAAALDTAWHDFSIVCDSTAGQVRFYVDRQLAATHTTDLPSSETDYMTFYAEAWNGSTSTNRYGDIDVIVIAEAGP